jgi:hypothetical protein
VLWLSAFGGDDVQRRNRAATGVLALLLTSMHMTALGVLLALPPRPLYAHVGGVAGLTPLQDQHLGGAIMLLIGGASYLVGGLWLTREVLQGTESKHEDLKPNPVSATRDEGVSLPRRRESHPATVSRRRESWALPKSVQTTVEGRARQTRCPTRILDFFRAMTTGWKKCS